MANADLRHELDTRPQSHGEWSGGLRSLVLPLGLVVLIVGGLLYYQSRSSSDDANAGYGSVVLPAERNPTGRPAAAENGRAAPDFLLRTLDGDPLRLSDFQGKPLLVNFWATWCAPCRAEMPDLVEAYEQYRAQGFVVLAVNQREADARVRPFVDEFGLPFPIVLDRNGEVGRTWRIGGPFQGLPSSYFIDRNGVVQKVVYGRITAKALSEGLGLILGAGN